MDCLGFNSSIKFTLTETLSIGIRIAEQFTCQNIFMALSECVWRLYPKIRRWTPGKLNFCSPNKSFCDRNFSWLLIFAVCKRHMRLCCRWIIKFLFWLLKFINCYARSPMIKREIKCFSHMSSTSCCFHLQFGYKLQAFVFPSIARPEFTLCQFRIRFSLKFACRVDLSNFVLILSHCRQIDEMRCIKCLSRDYVNDLVTIWSVMSTFESD